MADDAGYVLVKGDVGLGNRILCLLSAILFARLTGRRLVVDWRDPIYARDGRDAFERLLRVDLAMPLAQLPDTDSVLPEVWRGHLELPAEDMRRRVLRSRYMDPLVWQRYSIALDRIDHRARVVVFTSFFEQIEPLRPYLTGALAPLRELRAPAILQRLWSEHLQLVPELQQRVDAFRTAHFTGETLGVHVRASDRRTRVGALEGRAAHLLSLHPRLRVFLATDNEAVLQRWDARFGGVLATDKWYPPAGAAMHMHDERPDPTTGAADALVDLHLLAACDRLIVDSRSSFGRLAALRSNAPAAQVLDLHPWRFLPTAARHALLRWESRVRRLRFRVGLGSRPLLAKRPPR